MNMKKEMRKGQVTIFIIIAIIIVVILAIVLYPRIKNTYFAPQTSTGFLESCINEKLNPVLNKLEIMSSSCVYVRVKEFRMF